MAKVKPIWPLMSKSQQQLAQKLKTALREGLKVGGVVARIFVEPVPETKLLRVGVTSPNFASLRPSERQDLVWRIASSALTPEEQLCISMIRTLTPHELVGAGKSEHPKESLK